MKTLCVLCGDGVRVRLYRTSAAGEEITLIYHQVIFGGQIDEFARSLCRLLAANHRAGKFDGLVLLGTPALLEALAANLAAECRPFLLATAVCEDQRFAEADILRQLAAVLGRASPDAESAQAESRADAPES